MRTINPPATFDKLLCIARPMATPAEDTTATIESIGIPSIVNTIIRTNAKIIIFTSELRKRCIVLSSLLFSIPLPKRFIITELRTQPITKTIIARSNVGRKSRKLLSIVIKKFSIGFDELIFRPP